jgi:acyl-CoA dehydrogenase
MEQIAFGDFQLHAMSHRQGVFGLANPVHPVAKYAFQYLFVQAEFGLMCPVSVSDTSAYLIRKYASPALQNKLLPRMLSGDLNTLWKGTQFITEKSGGSDVGAIETIAIDQGGTWRLSGEKWFCSHTDADVALLLARPEGAPNGTKGLALFAMPRRLEDGTRNSYRIVRLKDKLGTRSMASGEIKLEGAVAYLVGEQGAGFRQMLDQINLSRLSHGIRAAAMMRRCLNESLAVAKHRVAFGRPIIEHPLLRRQLMKIMVPTEQALSMTLFAASMMAEADAGSNEAADALRILTPLIKFRACRDNISVATGAMEVRGGNGYIEEWVNARLVRDAHIGVLWEGTSNINALDVIGRAVGRAGVHKALASVLENKLEHARGLPSSFRAKLQTALGRAIALAESVATERDQEEQSRRAASALYHAASAILLAHEGALNYTDGRRALLSRMVLDHRLSPDDPLAVQDSRHEPAIMAALLSNQPVSIQRYSDGLTA